MISTSSNIEGQKVPHKFYGLSTDEKPTTFNGCCIVNGSLFYEMDTFKFFMFDELNGLWLEQFSANGGGGTGGGTSDAVQYIPQELTEEQQMQTRRNLGLYNTYTGREKTCVTTVMHDGGSWENFEKPKFYPPASLDGFTPDNDALYSGGYYDAIIEAPDGTTWDAKVVVIDDTVSYIMGWWVGNYSLIPNIDIPEVGQSVDCPVAWYYDGGSVRVYVDPNYTYENYAEFKLYHLGNQKEIVEPIPEEYIPDTIARKTDIPDGGDYDIVIERKEDNYNKTGSLAILETRIVQGSVEKLWEKFESKQPIRAYIGYTYVPDYANVPIYYSLPVTSIGSTGVHLQLIASYIDPNQGVHQLTFVIVKVKRDGSFS